MRSRGALRADEALPAVVVEEGLAEQEVGEEEEQEVGEEEEESRRVELQRWSR